MNCCLQLLRTWNVTGYFICPGHGGSSSELLLSRYTRLGWLLLLRMACLEAILSVKALSTLQEAFFGGCIGQQGPAR